MKKKAPKTTKKSSKKSTEVTTKAKKARPSVVAQPMNWDHLHNTLSFMYNNLTSGDLLADPNDQKSLSKITEALNEAEPLLFSLIQDMPKEIFNNPKEDAQFSNDLNNILHGLKHLSSMVNKHLSVNK